MKISAVCIAKNEEKNITRWYNSAKAYADEIIVVDTGSTDKTVETAKKLGARVEFFAWTGDFSAAKNYALSLASGEWVTFLDADEWFEKKDAPEVRKLVEGFNLKKQVVGVMMPLINIDTSGHNRFLAMAHQLRIFRNMRDIRYMHRIHESLAGLDKKGRVIVYEENIKIYHSGYSSAIAKEKMRRNLAMLEEKIAERGGEKEPGDDAYLADCYFGLGEYEKAVCHARKHIESKIKRAGSESMIYYNLIASRYFRGDPADEIKKDVEEAEAAYPGTAMFSFLLGLSYERDKDYQTALKYLDKGFGILNAPKAKLTNESVNDRVNNDNPGDQLLPRVYVTCGNIFNMRGDYGRAVDYWLKSLKIYPFYIDALHPLLRTIGRDEAIGAVEIIALLQSIFKDSDDQEAAEKLILDAVYPLAKFSRSLSEVYAFYLKRRGDDATDMRRLLALKNFAAAASSGAAVCRTAELFNIAAALKMGGSDDLNGVLSVTGRTVYQALKEKEPLPKDISEAGKAILRFVKESIGVGPAEISETDTSDANAPAEEPAVNESDAAASQPEIKFAAELPLVSILIPTYNRPAYFEQTLISALAQTYPNVEVIVTDNSTNEETADLIAAKFASEPRLKYVRNAGAKTKAENFAPMEQLMHGEYMHWLMDDDLLEANKIEKMAGILQRFPNVRLVTSHRRFIDANGEPIADWYKHEEIYKFIGEYKIFPGEEIGRQILTDLRNFIGEPSTVLHRTADLTHHYWQAESKGYKTLSDVAMWLELLEKGDLVIFKEPLSSYRRHDGQEGQSLDTIILSRFEWEQLIDEYHRRGIFIPDNVNYIAGLSRLYHDAITRLKDIGPNSPIYGQAFKRFVKRLSYKVGI